MKFYDFVEKAPKIPKIVVVEGAEPPLIERAIEIVTSRLVPLDMQQLNVERFSAPALDSFGPVGAALSAMPFLAEARVVIVRDAGALNVKARDALWSVADGIPEGNTLVLEDRPPAGKRTPAPLGKGVRTVLRIDCDADSEARERYVQELLAQLGVTAERRLIGIIANGKSDLAALQTDLEKLAIGGATITLEDFERETIAVSDVKPYKYAAAVAEGRTAEALAIAAEIFENEPRDAVVPMLYALATEYGALWEAGRPGGEIPARLRWKERALRAGARRLGEPAARRGYALIVGAFESLVTGRVAEPRQILEVLTAELGALAGR